LCGAATVVSGDRAHDQIDIAPAVERTNFTAPQTHLTCRARRHIPSRIERLRRREHACARSTLHSPRLSSSGQRRRDRCASRGRAPARSRRHSRSASERLPQIAAPHPCAVLRGTAIQII
jgi:hypothetical protein